MTKDVLITIQGLQFAGGNANQAASDEELDAIETICPGEYFFKNDAHFFVYEEMIEGFDESIRNIIKLRGGEFTLIKKGAINVQMVFSEGKKTLTDYCTPFGNILIALDTRLVEMNESEGGMKIHIAYGLEANYQFIGDCDINVSVRNSGR